MLIDTDSYLQGESTEVLSIDRSGLALSTSMTELQIKLEQSPTYQSGVAALGQLLQQPGQTTQTLQDIVQTLTR
jgi:hypothetical protein